MERNEGNFLFNDALHTFYPDLWCHISIYYPSVHSFIHPSIHPSVHPFVLTLPLTLWMGSTTTATARSDSASKLCCVLMSTPDNQQPNPGWEWYHPTTISGLKRTVRKRFIERERNVLFNDALKTFYLRLYGVRRMAKDHSDSEKGNPLPPHGLLFPIRSKCSFICIIPQTGPWANALPLSYVLLPCFIEWCTQTHYHTVIQCWMDGWEHVLSVSLHAKNKLEGNVLFNDAPVIWHQTYDKGPFRMWESKPTDRIAHTMASVTLEREIAEWVHHEGSIQWPMAP